MTKDVKSFNAEVNEHIQELAVRVTDKKNPNIRKDMNELMSLLTPKLRFFIWGFMSSEDDTDDVLYNSLEKICASINTYNSDFRFTTWAFKIGKNEALTWLNKMPRNVVDIDECFYAVSNSVIDDSAEIVEKEEERDAVLADVYSEIQRVAMEEDNLPLLEKDINRRKGKDIAEQYNTCENTVKTRIRAGRKRVRERIFEIHPDLRAKRKNKPDAIMVVFEL